MQTILIGERITYKGRVFIAVPAVKGEANCTNCYFFDKAECPNTHYDAPFGPCDRMHRNDRKNIIWKCLPLVEIYQYV